MMIIKGPLHWIENVRHRRQCFFKRLGAIKKTIRESRTALRQLRAARKSLNLTDLRAAGEQFRFENRPRLRRIKADLTQLSRKRHNN